MRRIRSASPKFSPAIKGIPLNTSPQEALVRTDGHSKLHIEYEILLSPTYQVPVLYFVLHWDNQGPIGLDAVYRYLVPESYRKQLKNVGVMGGISFGVGGISSPPFPSQQKTKRKGRLNDVQWLMSRSIIRNLALRLSLFTRATRRMPWEGLQMHGR